MSKPFIDRVYTDKVIIKCINRMSAHIVIEELSNVYTHWRTTVGDLPKVIDKSKPVYFSFYDTGFWFTLSHDGYEKKGYEVMSFGVAIGQTKDIPILFKVKI